MEKIIFTTRETKKNYKRQRKKLWKEQGIKLLFNDSSKNNEMPGCICFYDVSSMGQTPFNKLSPFYVHGGEGNKIPIPEMPGCFSDTVEGIWQGLKIIDGSIDESLFVGRPYKRKYKPYSETKFKYGETEIDLIEARHQLYVPAYTWMWENCIPDDVKQTFIRRFGQGYVQYFYDIGRNGDIENTKGGYAHASLLVDILKKELGEQ